MKFKFTELPKTDSELREMAEFGFDSPFRVAALLIAVLTAWPEDKDECYTMIDTLKGPQKLSAYDRSFIRDRMMNKGDYIGKAYFQGATPDNNYTPKEPYTIEVEENPYSYDNAGYAKLYVRTKGADGPRPITLRSKGGKEWFLWEFPGILSDIRKPKAEDPWA